MLATTRHRLPGASLLTLLLAVLLVLPAAAQPTNPRAIQNHTTEITLMSTADVHDRVLDWHYVNDEPYATGRGFARLSTLVEQVRSDRGAERTLLFDAGDTIQGTVLGDYFARRDPITEGATHPVATAMNVMGYTAMTVGNHEFNFGLDHLDAFQDQLDAPMLGANVLHAGTDDPAFEPYIIETVNLRGHKPIRVGVLGLTTPGSAVWDRSYVEGILDFVGGLETAERYVPKMRAEGADVVVVVMHAGMGSGSSYGDLLPFPENFGTAVAEQVPGIDVIFPAHSHRVTPQDYVANLETGQKVLVSQPGSQGTHLSVADLELRKVRGQWTVTSATSTALSADGVPEDPRIVGLVWDQHQAVIDYVATPIGTSIEELSMEEADFKDVAVMDLINTVQAEAVETGIVGTEYEDHPVLSITAPLARDARIPQGDVTIRDIAAIYRFPNTLRAVVLTGDQVHDYLEWSAEYFYQVDHAGPFARPEIAGTRATFCYDVIHGVSYDIDLGQPAGERITNLTYASQPIDADEEFVVAINNYRHGGGCGPPHTTHAPIAYFGNPEIQELLIQYIQAREILDPAEFWTVDWRLVYQGEPVTVTP